MLFKSMLIFVSLVLLLSACDDPENRNSKSIDKQKLEESLVKVNRKYIDVENQQIDDFMHRRKWNGFIKTNTGLRYYIYKKGIGKIPIAGSMVGVEYTISDIKGNLLYDSKKLGKKVFQIDKNEEPTGLDEALRLMKLGAKAKLIVPSYLAYGLLGDENKIGQKVTLIYDVYLTEVN